jgi:hypothetical protein
MNEIQDNYPALRRSGLSTRKAFLIYLLRAVGLDYHGLRDLLAANRNIDTYKEVASETCFETDSTLSESAASETRFESYLNLSESAASETRSETDSNLSEFAAEEIRFESYSNILESAAVQNVSRYLRKLSNNPKYEPNSYPAPSQDDPRQEQGTEEECTEISAVQRNPKLEERHQCLAQDPHLQRAALSKGRDRVLRNLGVLNSRRQVTWVKPKRRVREEGVRLIIMRDS